MVRWPATLLTALGVVLTATASSRADDFLFRINVDLGDRQVRTEETIEAPTTKQQQRPAAEFNHDQPVSVAWHAENTGKSEMFKDVLVHFFVVQEEKVGQAEVPKLTEDVTYEGALTMDFKPGQAADWKWTLNIHEPGNYLLRVETIGMASGHGHEHFAAMDLVVK